MLLLIQVVKETIRFCLRQAERLSWVKSLYLNICSGNIFLFLCPLTVSTHKLRLTAELVIEHWENLEFKLQEYSHFNCIFFSAKFFVWTLSQIITVFLVSCLHLPIT